MIEREIELLPRIAPLLPAPIPVPLLVGEPSEEFPWSFYATRFLPGEEAALVELDDASRVAVGLDLARFLRALHAIELDAELPVDVNGRADMPGRAERLRALTGRLGASGVWVAPSGVEELLTEAVALPPPRLDRLVHGDLYPRNFLVHEAPTERCHRLDRSRPFRSSDRPVVLVELRSASRPGRRSQRRTAVSTTRRFCARASWRSSWAA